MKRQMRNTPSGPIEKRGLNDPIFGRGELQDYTKAKLGFLKGRGQIVECPICHRSGVERRWKRGGGHVIHSEQMVSMLGMFCTEIIGSCSVNKDIWPLPEVGA